MTNWHNYFRIAVICLISVLVSNVRELSAETSAPSTIFVVNSTFDFTDLMDDGLCLAAGNLCTLRAAIEEANRDPGHDIIRFDLGSGSSSILPTSPLPEITTKITIDGTNNPNSGLNGTCPTATTQGNYSITLSGFNAPLNSNGLTIGPGGSNSVISGLNIVLWKGDSSSSGAGVYIKRNSNNNLITCNHIGISNIAFNGSQNNVGIFIQGSNNEIGGVPAGERNVIVSDDVGVRISPTGGDPADENLIQGNYIGTNHLATAAVGSARIGIQVSGDSNVIGSTDAGNVIGGATEPGGAGIHINATNTSIASNKIGSDASGLNPIPNVNGVVFFNSVSTSNNNSNTLGGSFSEGNVIAFNSDVGISLGSNSNRISHNDIHTNGNYGIEFVEGGNNVIESNGIHNNGSHGIIHEIAAIHFADVLSNSIYDNNGSGIFIDTSGNPIDIVSNTIYGNSGDGVTTLVTPSSYQMNNVYNNGGMGIDISTDGVSTDRVADLQSVLPGGEISGEVFSTTSSRSITVEVFVNDTCDDQFSGGQPYGEGQTFHGSFTVPGVNNATVAFTGNVPPILPNKFVTILTYQDGNYYEYSNCISVAVPTFVVVSNGNSHDTDPGDGLCNGTIGDFCTLVAAIEEVNALGGNGRRIEFALGNNISTIIIGDTLELTTPVVIDGSSNDGASCASGGTSDDLNIQVSGLLLSDGEHIMRLADGSDGSEIRGLAFVGAPTGSDGLRINSNDNVIACNRFGIQVNDAAGGNGDDGIHVAGGNNNRIGVINDLADRNIFGFNGGAAIQITDASIGTVVRGNTIGSDVADRGNGYGIDVSGGSDNTTIGGSTLVQRNLVYGSTTDAVLIQTSAFITVGWNTIGSDGIGGNGRYGIQVNDSAEILIEGSDIINSDSHGVYIRDSNNVAITENKIEGSGSGGNGSGVAVIRSAGLTIGGVNGAQTGNEIYGNIGSGIYLTNAVSDVTIRHNEIGPTFASAIGNTYDGIHANSGVTDVDIRHNTINENGRNGVRVNNSSSGVIMLSNQIVDNIGIAIDLDGLGATVNDKVPDPDSGANGLTNYAIVTLAEELNGSLRAELLAKPDTAYLIEFFASGSCVNPQGETILIQVPVTTDSAGFAEAVGSAFGDFSENDHITTTATEEAGDGTSEFSPCFSATQGTPTRVALANQQLADGKQSDVLVMNLVGLVLLTMYGIGFGRKPLIGSGD